MTKAKFQDIADQQWRILLEATDMNEPSIVAINTERPGHLIGPLAVVPVGETEEDEEGYEKLCLDSEDGMTLAAIACLPQIAELFRWVRTCGDMTPVAFYEQLCDRICWIESCIDERDDLHSGQHGFERYRQHS